ncbi:uncharacterized protein BXZ73DRAFT_98287 [Epithele typhae]|uniref:uncharacterized protein n=1 Tax=Epithele typhae TaxID=378194 RepID=UPI0020085173|nr:uncharacterized protein BXZ73DRAFT_98287 [Epithele typhae]KAH9941898.1 hypothetical protein BXZ73DRAFT_98287 [Epithele typhae]
MSANTVTATLSFFAPPDNGEKPYYWIDDLPGRERANYKRDKIKAEYYPESIALIKEITGAAQVVPFDHTVRRRNPAEAESSAEKRQPVPYPHVDQTPASARDRVERHMPAPAVTGLLAKRFQIINLWRPIGRPALDWPLALCDARTYADRDGETYSVQYHERYAWKYVRGLTPDEFVLIKCFDSIDDRSVAALTPHTAFEDPTTPKDAPFRESIEVRFLVFYD